MGSFGKSPPSLDKMASICEIPSKLGVIRKDVAQLWLSGHLWEIVAYNDCDALTTYLIWLRLAFFDEFINPIQYREEQERVQKLLCA